MTLALSEVFMADVPEKNLSCPLRCDVPKGEEWKTAKPSDWGQVRVWGGPRMSQMLREMLTRRRETELSNMPILSFRITNDAPRTGLAVRAEKTHASNILQYLKRGTVVKMYVPKAMIKEGAKLKLPNWACLTYPVFHGWICTKANGYELRMQHTTIALLPPRTPILLIALRLRVPIAGRPPTTFSSPCPFTSTASRRSPSRGSRGRYRRRASIST